ncbi:hypothetical protein D3C71_1750880 [compost metagenome]
MAYHMVDRGADVGGVGRHARGLVAQAGGFGALLFHGFGAQQVDLLGGDAWLDVGGDVIQNLRGQAACDAHLCNVFFGIDFDGHSP